MERDRIISYLIQSAGEENISSDDISIRKYAAGINGSFVMPLCVVFPQSVEAVVEIVKLANQHQFVLYPVSKGKNLGYGDAQGTSANQVVIDFSRMNKIVEVNTTLCYATIQPGVTQEQLSGYLKASGSNLQLDVTGAGLEASIVGNILERGFGHTDYGDRFSKVINMTVVTPDGKIIRTGFGDFSGANAKNVYRYGFGPIVDGLFTQSNFGIVTEIAIELMPVPEKNIMFVFSTNNSSDLRNIITVVRELKLHGVVNSAIHIANKSRAVGEKDNKFVGAWNLSGSISGPSSVVFAKKREVKKLFSRHVKKFKLWFVNEWMVRSLGWIYNHITKVPVYRPLKDVFDLQKGVPTDEPLRTLLNDETLSSKTISSLNYSTCFSWINAVCAAEEESVERIIQLLSGLFSENNYEFRVTLTAVNPRTLILISNISYPREEESIKKAEQFCRLCARELNANGFYPYRSGSGMYDKLPVHSESYIEFIRKIKSSFDPNNILAPGKYNI
jgi:4-cresol dehydrogenase (hydroxylating)